MAPLCLLYFAAVALCLGIAAHLAERALPPAAPRRWIWVAAFLFSFFLPPFLSARHSSHVVDLWGRELVRLPSVDPVSAAAQSDATLNWLECSAAYGRATLPVWLGVTIVLLLWGIANAVRVARLVRRSHGAPGTDRRYAVVDGAEVVVTDRLGPATTGSLRSRVLLPRWVLALPAAQRRYVVQHEEQHRRAHDAAVLCFASVLVALMPWNVSLWWMLRRLQLAIEVDCDRRVVAALGDSDRYAELLLTVAETASRGPRLQPALLGAGMLERRLIALVAPARRALADRLLAPLLALAIIAIVLSVPHPQLESHAHEHSSGSASSAASEHR